ncbi:MAG: hypothetical protein ABJB12_08335 [Pseudomonadota bacterium]
MPLPLVVVEVPAQDRGTSECAALLEACTKGLGGGQCELSDRSNGAAVSGVAILSWRDEGHLSALLEVARAQKPSEGWRSEELGFKPEDRKLERFRTLGLAIATLFREASLPGANEETKASPAGSAVQNAKTREEGANRAKPAPRTQPQSGHEPEQPQPAASTSTHPPHPAQAWVSAGALAVYDPKLGSVHYGGELRLAIGAAGFPAFVSALGSYTAGPEVAGVALDWATLGLGPGLRFTLSPSVEFRAVAQGLAVNVSGRVSELERSARQNAWLPGAGLDLEFALRASGRLSGAVGAQLQQVAGNVPIREHDRPAGTVGKTTFGVTLRLELRVFGEAGAD